VELAAQAGCGTLALTDHDGLAGIEEARSTAAALGIGFIPGCEVSCKFSPGTLHMLCYFVEPGDGPLQDLLESLRQDRATRNARLVERLNELGAGITMEDVEAEAGGTTLGRPHFAAALVKRGVASSYEDAFDRLLGKGRPAYIPKAVVSPEAAIEAARASGALAVLAHPLSLGLDPASLERAVAELAAAGLAGIESWYGRYDDEERAGLASIAKRHGLVATGGSDYHGTFKPDLSVGIGRGDLDVPDSVPDELAARRDG